MKLNRLQLGIAFAIAVVVLIIGTGLAYRAQEDDPLQSDEAAVRAVVAQFFEALINKDGDRLYALQTEAYRSVCPREEFENVVAALPATRYAGPTDVTITGDIAGAAVIEVGEEGTERAVIPLIREAPGRWRLAAPSSNACR